MRDQSTKKKQDGPRSAIACATRGGEASRATEDRAIALAREQDADIIFLYVIDASFAHGLSGKFSIDVVEDDLRDIGTIILEQAVQRAQDAGVAARSVIREGNVADEIQRFVENHGNVTVLVIGHMSEDLRTHLEPVLHDLQQRQLEVLVVSNP